MMSSKSEEIYCEQAIHSRIVSIVSRKKISLYLLFILTTVLFFNPEKGAVKHNIGISFKDYIIADYMGGLL